MTAKALIEGIFLAKSANCPLSSALRLHIADYFYRQAPHTGLVDPESRLAFRIERPRKSRKGDKRLGSGAERRAQRAPEGVWSKGT